MNATQTSDIYDATEIYSLMTFKTSLIVTLV